MPFYPRGESGSTPAARSNSRAKTGIPAYTYHRGLTFHRRGGGPSTYRNTRAHAFPYRQYACPRRSTKGDDTKAANSVGEYYFHALRCHVIRGAKSTIK